jgi:hypothetical protein
MPVPEIPDCTAETATPSASADLSAVTSVTVVSAQPVFLKTTAEWDLSKADAIPAARTMGLALSDVSASFVLEVRARGSVVLSEAIWDAVTGDSGGLTPAARYYVSAATAGKLVKVPPASGHIVKIGRAINTTTMDLEIQRRIKL